jgi:hypothetical protein
LNLPIVMTVPTIVPAMSLGTADLERERSRLREAQRLRLNPLAPPFPRFGGSIPSLATKINDLGQHGRINCGISDEYSTVRMSGRA